MASHPGQHAAARAASRAHPRDPIPAFVLPAETTMRDLREVARSMLARRNAEVYVELAGGGDGYYLPAALRIDEQGDLVIVVIPAEERWSPPRWAP